MKSTASYDDDLADGFLITDKAVRPSSMANGPYVKKKRNRKKVAVMTERFDRGLDIWTGEPLPAEDCKDWVQLFFQGEEITEDG